MGTVLDEGAALRFFAGSTAKSVGCTRFLSLQIITTCGHKVGWLIAQKSWDRMVPGFFARAMACIPVTRPQVGVACLLGIDRMRWHFEVLPNVCNQFALRVFW